jgi:hypothetical protein
MASIKVVVLMDGVPFFMRFIILHSLLFLVFIGNDQPTAVGGFHWPFWGYAKETTL